MATSIEKVSAVGLVRLTPSFTRINPRIMISFGPGTCHLHAAAPSSSIFFSNKLSFPSTPFSVLPLFQPGEHIGSEACYRLYMLYFFKCVCVCDGGKGRLFAAAAVRVN